MAESASLIDIEGNLPLPILKGGKKTTPWGYVKYAEMRDFFKNKYVDFKPRVKNNITVDFATVIAVMAICGGIETAHAGGDEEYDSDMCYSEQGFLCGRNAECTAYLGSGYTCDVVSGCCISSGSTSCSCPSGYSGTCTKNDYSTCYKSCSVSCLNAGGLDTAACRNSVAGGNGWVDCSDQSNYTITNVTGTQYYGGSCSSNTKCAFYNNCAATCPSGYTDGGTVFNGCKYGYGDACYKTCSSYQSGGYTYTPSGNAYYPSSCSYSSTCTTHCNTRSNTSRQSTTTETESGLSCSQGCSASCSETCSETCSQGCSTSCSETCSVSCGVYETCPTGYTCTYNATTCSGTKTGTKIGTQYGTRYGTRYGTKYGTQ